MTMLDIGEIEVENFFGLEGAVTTKETMST
jgi:hypothetical protein